MIMTSRMRIFITRSETARPTIGSYARRLIFAALALVTTYNCATRFRSTIRGEQFDVRVALGLCEQAPRAYHTHITLTSLHTPPSCTFLPSITQPVHGIFGPFDAGAHVLSR